MKALLFYRPNSEHERVVLDYLRDFERQTGKKLETVDVDTLEGSSMCRTYDITRYPTILARDNTGRVLQIWQGEPLPLMGEVSYYIQD